MQGPDGLPVMQFEDSNAFDAWLRAHHERDAGIWLRVAKQASELQLVRRTDVVPVALCWGWIDGQVRRLDDDSFLVRLTPRRPRSVWSRINVAHVERLIAEGRMQPAGLAKVDAAKADGRWDAAY